MNSMALHRAVIVLLALASVVHSSTIHDVKEVPGFGAPLSRTAAGFVEADKATNSNLWYMFFEKQGDVSADTPLLIWLNGGPGASSALGNMLENGPYRLQPDGTLKAFPQTWSKLAHIIYFDQPAGTGYSYCDDTGYVKNNEEMASRFSTAVLNWYAIHPEYRSNPLYITGESYAGIYIPAIAAHILTKEPRLSLAGLLIGNPGNFHYTQYRGQIEFARSHGMINDRQAAHAYTLWSECSALYEKKEMFASFQKCQEMNKWIFAQAGNPFLYNIEQWGDRFDDVLAPIMANYFADPKTKKLLNAGDHEWKNGDGTANPNPVVNALNATLMDPALDNLEIILSHGVPLRIYDGVLDGSSCNHMSVFQSLTMLQWPGKEEFLNAARTAFKVPGSKNPAGYVQSGGGLSFVWVWQSGHLVPTDQPEAGLQVLADFLESTQTKLYTQLMM